MKKCWFLLLLCLLTLPALAEEGQVINTEAWAGYTVLLTEEAEGRYITVRTEEGVRHSGPWPRDTIFYGVWRKGVIELLWDERVAWYGLQPDGTWRLTGLHDVGASCWLVAAPWGMYEPNGEAVIVGNCTPDLFTGPVGDALFDMAASPDRTGLAVVKVESAPLYAGPDGGESLGTFFAGTPAKVLAEQDGWVRLSVAAEPSLTGWMRADQLALGEDAVGVERTDIRYTLPESEWDRMPDAPPYHAIGVQGPFVILLTGEGVEYAVYDSLAPAESWFRPEMIRDVVWAELKCGKTSLICTDPVALAALTGLLTHVQDAGGRTADCPFTVSLKVERADGQQVRVQLATDSCCVYRVDGRDYQYGEGGADNSVLFGLFGVDAQQNNLQAALPANAYCFIDAPLYTNPGDAQALVTLPRGTQVWWQFSTEDGAFGYVEADLDGERLQGYAPWNSLHAFDDGTASTRAMAAVQVHMGWSQQETEAYRLYTPVMQEQNQFICVTVLSETEPNWRFRVRLDQLTGGVRSITRE